MPGWLTTFSDANKVIVEESTFEHFLVRVWDVGDDPPPRWKVKMTTTKFSHTSMTLAAARACRNHYNAIVNTEATLRRGGDADQYVVDVLQKTTTVTRA